MPELRFPTGLDATRFLREYWQQRPLLMRAALPGAANPLSPDELAGLACEPGVESRLVIEHGDTPWQVHHGPFDENVFATLPERHWTLLVQDVDKLVPAATALSQPFAFLPRWRMDDVMVSYAPDQGSVGPHLDAYDVFLIQTLGRRRWRISTRPYTDADLIPDLDIRVLADFVTEQEWLLEPGDVLYLPPGVAHWGVAEGEHCMTCSVGFRSPSQSELTSSWFEHLLARSDDQRRYRDPRQLPVGLGGRIPTEVVDQVRQLLASFAEWPDTELTAWFGGFITERKPHLVPESPSAPLHRDALVRQLNAGWRLVAHPFSRLAYADEGNGRLTLFVDGDAHAHIPFSEVLADLCDHRPAGSAELPAELIVLLTRLFNQGSLIWHDHDED